jgi:hypothetical protein
LKLRMVAPSFTSSCAAADNRSTRPPGLSDQ